MTMLTREEFRDGMADLKADIQGIHVRLDRMNGPVDKIEDRAGELATKVAVLEERSPGKIAGLGALIGGAVGGAVSWFSGRGGGG
jgi:hypothetical protein